jgi:hypothetical protein
MIAAALVALGALTLSIAPASAQQPSTTQQPTVIVPAPSASPPTVVAPGPSGTTVVAPPGSTVTVTPPPAPAPVAVRTQPWCSGTYATPGGTNFGSCPGNIPQ